MDALETVLQFRNFLSWDEKPVLNGIKAYYPDVNFSPRQVPPAWWAYALGYTTYCPPKDEL